MFKSGEPFAAAWLFLPETAAPGARVPAVAMAHGLGAVKEMYLEFFARRFAEAGIAALLFDYRYFGASGGGARAHEGPPHPRQGYPSPQTRVFLPPQVHSARIGVSGTRFNCAAALHVS